MNTILFLILITPTMIFAGGSDDSRPTGLQMYMAAMEKEHVERSAEVVFKTNAERGAELQSGFLIDLPNMTDFEKNFRLDGRKMMVEIAQWQSKKGKNSSSSYVKEVYFNSLGTSSVEWIFRRRELLVELAGRIAVAADRERQQRLQQSAPTEYGGNPSMYRIPLFN